MRKTFALILVVYRYPLRQDGHPHINQIQRTRIVIYYFAIPKIRLLTKVILDNGHRNSETMNLQSKTILKYKHYK